MDDVVRANATLCVQDRISDFFVTMHPQTNGIIKTKIGMRAINLLDELELGNCDAVAITSRDYESAGRYSKTYCDYVMLRDTVLLDVKVAIPISDDLEEWGDDLISGINRIMDERVFSTANVFAQLLLRH